MKFFKRLTALCLSSVLIFSLSACGDSRDKTAKNLDIESYVTVTVWYNDENYTDYLNQVAEDFHKANELVTIQPQYVTSDDYLTDLYEESVNNNNAADVFLMSSDDMQKAYLMGLLTENTSNQDVYTTSYYGQAALDAASYKGKLYGYPVSFNTSFLLYNKKYASAVSTFTELTDYCDNYTVNEENQDVQRIITWNVSNMFLNYGFISSYLEINAVNNSSSAEESSVVKSSPMSIKTALKAYSLLKDTYGIDRSEVTTQSAIDSFKEGKLIYTIIDANNLNQLNDSEIDYGIAAVPDLTTDLKTNAISETMLAIVNSYSKNTTVAKAVAKAISYDYADQLQNTTGLLPARSNLKYTSHKEAYESLYQIYADSVPKSGLIAASEMYMRYEIMIHQIWDGKSVDDSYNQFDSFLSTLN